MISITSNETSHFYFVLSTEPLVYDGPLLYRGAPVSLELDHHSSVLSLSFEIAALRRLFRFVLILSLFGTSSFFRRALASLGR